MKKSTELTYEVGSDNVFADLGLDNSGELKLKSKIAFLINCEIEKRGLKQKDAAALLDISQPQVSSLSKGKLYRFSVEKLLHLFLALDQDVEIVIKKKPRARPARIRVKAA
ncbi:MAG: helix-turn-helix domain-containing protein [Thiohalomonadales bacterium]